MRTRFQLAAIALVALIVAAACSGSAGNTTPAKTPVPTLAAGPTPVATPVPETIPPTETATPLPSIAETPAATETAAATTEATPAETVAPSASPLPTVSADCMKGTVATRNSGRLTLSTDNPAYPPWWGGDPKTQYPNEPAGGDRWKLSDPYSMMGYEGATAYAVAAKLGFTPADIDWIQNTVFENAFKPGPKDFDYHLAQISIRPGRAQRVDFSDPYFDANQALISMTKASDGSPNPILSVTTIAGLKPFKLGAAFGTTSLELIQNVIQPDQQPSVLNDNNGALQALKNGQIDGLVVDLNTAFYMRDAQLEDFGTPDPEATIVGQFDVSAQTDQMGIVLEKGSALTACVDQALAVMKADGTLATIYDTWISTGQVIPFFK
jgi:polar amino acid transport system substrate-binding protein